MPLRSDLVGRSTELLPARVTRARALLEAAGEAGVEQELCSGHCRRWISQGRPDLAGFIATTKAKIVYYEQPRPCEVTDCRVGRSGGWLCPHHHRAWIAAGKPPVRDWAAGVLITEPQGPVCAIERCPLAARRTGPATGSRRRAGPAR